jgi:hypothetical protein
MKKGAEFLGDLHLGEGPPVEFVIKNLKIDEDLYRDEGSLKDVLQRNKNNIQKTKNRIEMLKLKQQANQFEYLSDLRPYNGELKPFLQMAPPETLFIARKIVDDIVEDTINALLDRESKINNVEA